MSRFASLSQSPPVVLKPQDVAILLKLVVLENRARRSEDGRSPTPIRLKQLAEGKLISVSETHNALERARFAGLLRQEERRVRRSGLLELIEHGVRCVFPPTRGGMVRGIPTAHAAAPLFALFISGDAPIPVWEYSEGNRRGLAFSPLYPKAPAAALLDADFYELLALTDVLRSDARARERSTAKKFLRERIEEKLNDDRRY